MKKTLPIFSYIFHPLFIGTQAALFYFFCNSTYYTNQEKQFALFQIVMLNIVLPFLFFFILKVAGRINSMMMASISERKIPLLVQCVLISILIQKGITIQRFPELYFFFLGGLLSTILAFILLFVTIKTSIHMVAISTLTIFVIGLSIHNQIRNSGWIAFLVLMNGFVASSRLEMKAHTPTELAFGFLCGIMPQLFLLRCWL